MQPVVKILLLFLLPALSFIAAKTHAAELLFDPIHGFYDQEIRVSITPIAPYITVHYTLDGSTPTATVGQSTRLYQNPITINKTSVIRALAISSNGSTSAVLTQTYLFVDDVIRQDHQATLDAGFPSRWGALTPDYGMDPDIVNDAEYAPRLKVSLLAIPSLSIVMNIDDLFGADGIYTNSEQSGIAWERPGSAELIFPAGKAGFQINCGLRMQGGWFRQDGGTKKHSFRLLFKTEYGFDKLRYPLFGENAADRFDTIVLRAGANDGYSWNAARYTEQYTRDEFGRRLHGWTGNVSPHGMFVHLYLNGIYWGLYNPLERPDDSFSAVYLGGDKNDWDAINSGALDEGTMDAWNLLLAKCRRGVSSLAAYMEIQGKNPDGTRNPDFPVLLDVQNYIDYMIVNMWGGNWDWPWKNYRITRDRTEAGTGFQFYIWDYENTMGNNRDRSPLDMDRVAGLTAMGSGVAEPHTSLVKNENYRMLFADRVHKHFINDGPFSPEFLIDRYRELAAEVELAIIPESARWGDQHFNSNPLTQADWFVERDWLLDTYLPQRSDIVMNQFRQANLYPDIAAPEFRVNGAAQHGGDINSTDQISLSAAAGTVYYTIDGADPRLFSASGGSRLVLVPEDAQKHVLVPQEYISLVWRSAPGFDATNWLSCFGKPGGIGYEKSSGYESFITLDVGDEMYIKYTSCYVRIPFDLGANVADSLAACCLRMRYDDGFIAWLNGTEIARKNFTGSPQWNSSAIAQNPDEAAVIFEDIDITQFIDKFKAGANILAIQGLNERTTSSDFLISAELTGETQGGNTTPATVAPTAIRYTTPLALNQTTQIKARAFADGQWSALNEAVFTLPLGQNNIIVSELHYHPLPQDSADESQFEFIELQNAGSKTQNLGLARFARGVNYVFPANTILRPNENLVLAGDAHYFAQRYGFSPLGVYSGQLDNGGERIALVDAAGDTLISFRYDDKLPWPEAADGAGYSLVLTNAEINTDYNNATSWHASKKIHGEPGQQNVFVRSENDNSPPVAFRLLQNYPNPFNISTTIQFSLPSESYIRLEVFDMVGRVTATLLHKKLAAGNHSYKWDAVNLPSGVYFYQLATNTGYKQSKKLLLLK